MAIPEVGSQKVQFTGMDSAVRSAEITRKITHTSNTRNQYCLYALNKLNSLLLCYYA